jgi:transposase
LKPGASVARVALVHGVNANQVFSWRRQYRQGLLSQRNAEPVKLLPVHVSEAQASKANRSGSRQVTAAVVGTIQVEFPKGHICV